MTYNLVKIMLKKNFMLIDKMKKYVYIYYKFKIQNPNYKYPDDNESIGILTTAEHPHSCSLKRNLSYNN